MSARPLLEIQGLSKEFYRKHAFRRERIRAVSSLDLVIHKGEIFAFLGPNGAGKTTTINMLVGFIQPTQGTITMFEEPFSHTSLALKQRIGYLPESANLPNHYRVFELLEFYCDLFFIPKAERKARINSRLEETGLLAHAKQWIRNLSMGQRRCLGLASALINDPDLLLLDEPTVYLDPLILEKFRSLLLRLKQQQKTVFMSSHTLSEVEKIADRFAIIKDGILRKQGEMRVLKKSGTLEEEFLKVIQENG